MDDLISRQAAINALRQEVIVCKLSLESPFLNNREKKDLQIRKAQAIEDIVAIEGLPSAERRGRWIPITERLPEEEGQYLISCDTDYGVEVGRFYIDEDGERYFGCDWNDPEDIEAWMPLPTPYKGGEKK